MKKQLEPATQMRVLLLCTLALGAFAMESGVHYDVSISVVVNNGKCGDNAVAALIAQAIDGPADNVMCAMEGQMARSSVKLSLSQAKWAAVLAFSENELWKAFNGEGDIVEFNANQEVDDMGACEGQSFIYVDGVAFQANGEEVNMRPVYGKGNDIVFYKDEMWLRQQGEGNPEEVEFTCDVECDNAALEQALERIDSLESDLEKCQADGGNNCSDNLRLPILVHNEWWFCDELLPNDCSDKLHGKAVTEHCPNLCGACGGENDVCDEKYHTKVLLPGIGSLYCDQLYPEECNIGEFVRETCCNTCN